ncbi:unnamed protein product [Linum tenue]|uniref:Uncharacterized protein n=1 Tax=Linum tenue TaxID=586396 RepID=A0AAV0QV68_9ROSI|nr:unnamed protein product [Linum tenue]
MVVASSQSIAGNPLVTRIPVSGGESLRLCLASDQLKSRKSWDLSMDWAWCDQRADFTLMGKFCRDPDLRGLLSFIFGRLLTLAGKALGGPSCREDLAHSFLPAPSLLCGFGFWFKKTPKSEQDGNEVRVIGGKVSYVVEDEWMHDGADSVRNASIGEADATIMDTHDSFGADSSFLLNRRH